MLHSNIATLKKTWNVEKINKTSIAELKLGEQWKAKNSPESGSESEAGQGYELRFSGVWNHVVCFWHFKV